MTNDKIIELARRYTYPDVREEQLFYVDGSPSREFTSMTYWKFCEEELIAFAQSLLEEERERIKGRFELAAKKIWPTGLPKNAGYMTSFESSLSAFTHVLLDNSQDDI